MAAAATTDLPAAVRCLVAGDWVEGSGPEVEIQNPAEPSTVTSRGRLAGPAEVEAALEAARAALPAWRATPAPGRGERIRRCAELLEQRKDVLAELMALEMGKLRQEAEGDVQEAIDMAWIAAGDGRRPHGVTVPSELPDKRAFTERKPYGVAALICPWNFPVAIPAWKCFPALVAGNTVVIKGSDLSPATTGAFVACLHEAGFPAGAVSYLPGDGAVGAALVEDRRTDCVSFTGSDGTGRLVAEACGRNLKPCALELGGKNAQVVLASADLELAVDGLMFGAFGTAGQRCTSTSRLIVERPVHGALLERLLARIAALRLGDPLASETDVGPLITAAARDRVAGAVEDATGRGLEPLTGGSVPERPGWFYEPTLLAGAVRGDRLWTEEVFGPVLVLEQADSLDQAVEMNNETPYGLSASVFAEDIGAALRFVDRAETGIVYVNAPTIGAEVQLPFGGAKGSGNGYREAGLRGIDQFSEPRTVYVDYSGRLQKAQIDTE